MQYVAKVELFERRWQGWILSRVGAFPIRRGQSDEIAMETAGIVARPRRNCLHLPRGHPHPVRLARDSDDEASDAWRSRPERRSSLSRRTAPSTSDAASGSGRAR